LQAIQTYRTISQRRVNLTRADSTMLHNRKNLSKK